MGGWVTGGDVGTVVPSVGNWADGTVEGSNGTGPRSNIAQPDANENSKDINITAMTGFLIYNLPIQNFDAIIVHLSVYFKVLCLVNIFAIF